MSGWVAGAVVVGAGVGAYASSSAANTQANAASNAANLQQQTAQNTIDMQKGMFDTTQGNLSPYRLTGQNAINALQPDVSAGTQALSGLQLYANTGQAANEQLSNDLGNGTLGGNFTSNELNSYLAPNYQWQLQQGDQALQSSQAAQDGALSGGALKGLINYNQNAAGSAYQQAYNNWLSSQQNTYSQLAGMSNTGANANNTLSGLGANAAQGVAGLGEAAAAGSAANGSAFANSMGNVAVGGANAAAAGITGAANANAAGTVGIANAIGGAASSGANYLTLNNLMGRNSSGGTASVVGDPSTFSSGGTSLANIYSSGLP